MQNELWRMHMQFMQKRKVKKSKIHIGQEYILMGRRPLPQASGVV